MTVSFESAYAPLRVETIPSGDTMRILIHGEADIANADHLDAALSAIQLDGTKSVLLDASRLTFFDATALRCLLGFAQSVKQTGRQITTCAAAPMLHEVARVLDLHDELGLHRPGPAVP